jgi:TorA maturation chaperone TorD
VRAGSTEGASVAEAPTSSPTSSADKAARLREATALGDCFGLLAVLLEYKLLEDVCAGLASGSIPADVRAIACELALRDPRVDAALQLFEEAGEEEALRSVGYRQMRQEYTRLFNHPERPELPFYEGAFVNRRYAKAGKEAPDHEVLFINQAACDADRQYRRAGVRRSMEENIPGDCMATEMAFMRHLLRAEVDALLADDPERLESLAAWRSEFARLHLQVWMREFFLELEASSPQQYYRAVGLLGQALADWYVARYPLAAHAGKGKGRGKVA